MKAVFQLTFVFCILVKLYCSDDTIYQRIKRTMLKGMNYKWTFPIEYTINSPLGPAVIQRAHKIIERETCITFKKVDSLTGPGLNYHYGNGCLSFIGKVSDTRPQDISLGFLCNQVGVVLHETAHALGAIHEMNRPDRDNHVFIYDKNIDPLLASNFERNPENKSITYGMKYDYGSLMHYDKFSGSSNGKLVTVPKNKHYVNTTGQTTEFGFNDVKQLNLYYCSYKCSKKLNCRVGGYTNPNRCNVCKCPRFYTGKLCNKIKTSDANCSKTKLFAEKKAKIFEIQGSKSCYIQIVTTKGSRIRMTILNATLPLSYTFVCQPNSGLEVKYLGDKSVSGIVFCGNVTNKTMTSENHVVVMRYVGKDLSHNIEIKYQKV